MASVYGDDKSTTLYKRDALGRIVYWQISTNGINDKVSFGLFERLSDVGQVIISASTKTSYNSQIKRKIDRGYKTAEMYGITDDMYESANQLHDLLDNVIPKFATDANNVDKPMKCQKWKRDIFDYSNGAMADPKINGVRCTIKYEAVDNGLFGISHEVVIRSKEGLRYNVKHIEDAFDRYVFYREDYKNITFDGELYIKDQKNTTIGGAARNPKNPLHKYLQFVNFDLSIPDVSNRDRYHLRRDILNKAWLNATSSNSNAIYIQFKPEEHDDTKNAKIVSLCSINIKGDSDVEAYRDRCIAAGYEGCVVRSKIAEYKFGSRPQTMMKAKRCEETECLCLDILVDKITKVIDGEEIIYEYAKFKCRNDLNNEIFEVKPTSVYNGVTDETMTSDYILGHRNQFIGKLLAIKFYERTDKKIPFNANAYGVRDYESNDD
jgi:hypothetical protein